jgi:two-component system sensor histidine kinase ComP
MFRYPLMGITVEREYKSGFMINRVDSFSEGARLGLKAGDIVTSVNGGNPENYWTVYRFGKLDQVDTMSVLRDGVLMNFKTNSAFSFYLYNNIYVIVEISSLLIAYLMYKKIKMSASSRAISVMFLIIALIFMSLGASVRGDPTGKVVLCAGLIIIPVAIYQFLRAFLKEKANIHLPSRFLKPVYYFFAVMFGMYTLIFMDSPYTYPVYKFMGNVVLFFCAIGICSNLFLLVYIYAQNRRKKNNLTIIIKTVFFSAFCALSPVIFFSFIPLFVFGKSWIDLLYTSWSIFILPLTFVYLLATRRLYDIDMIIRRILFTTAIALIPSFIFTAVIKIIFPVEATPERLVFLFLTLLFTSSFILYSLENLTTKLEPVLFPRKHRLQLALKKISGNLGMISSFREMKDTILVDIVETLEVVGGAIVFQYKDGMETILEGDLQKEQVEALIASEVMDSSFYTCFIISRQEEYTSYLVVAPKKATTLLGMEEINWLNLIITYLAVSLENVQLIRKLDGRIQQLSSLLPEEEEANNLIWFRKLMFEMQEKERIRIAMDLHDTTMQDLFFLKGRLQTMEEKYIVNQEGKTFLNSMTDYIDIINSNLRQSCFELHPYLLREIGLVATLSKFFQTERAVCNFQILFTTTEISEIEEQDMEIKRHLFRMVQELMNNAKKYSHASTVRFFISIKQSKLYFEYTDDGIGFEASRPVVREIGSSGIGMEQMKGRVLSLGGSYELKTATGQGVFFAAQLPVKSGRHSA